LEPSSKFFFNFNRPSKKAKIKDEKFGFGGRKKRAKYNTAESYAEAYQTPDKKKGKFSKNGKKPVGNGREKPNKKFMNKNKPKSKR
jgi:rRNA-processing protein EBP2